MSKKTDEDGLNIYMRERSNLIALASSILGNSYIAEEVVQESWIRWVGHSYPAEKATPIFRRIVANLSKDWYRAQKVEMRGLQSLLHEPQQALDAERVVIARQELREVAAILAELPPRTLMAFRMHRLDGLTYMQIGKHMGIGTTRVHQLLQNALVHVAVRRNA